MVSIENILFAILPTLNRLFAKKNFIVSHFLIIKLSLVHLHSVAVYVVPLYICLFTCFVVFVFFAILAVSDHYCIFIKKYLEFGSRLFDFLSFILIVRIHICCCLAPIQIPFCCRLIFNRKDMRLFGYSKIQQLPCEKIQNYFFSANFHCDASRCL